MGGGKGGIGKSFLAANLATVAARCGRRVILIDGDLGGANLHTCLGVNVGQRINLTDFFADRIERFEVKGDGGESAREPLRRVTGILSKEGDLSVDELERVVDLDAFLRYWAVESLIGFWDGYTNNQNNYFIYEKPGSSKVTE